MACSVISSFRIARRWQPTRRTSIRTIRRKTSAISAAWRRRYSDPRRRRLIGGKPALQEVVGFQMRGANSSIIGCSVLQAVGKGILIFHAGSSGVTITGNTIAGVKSVAGTLGIGIHLDSSGTSRHTVAGNVMKQCEGSAIVGEGGNNDVVVSGNVIDGTNLVVPDASIVFHGAQRVSIIGNKIINNHRGSPIAMKG